MLFCGIRVPEPKTFSFFFNLDQVSITRGPNRKQVAHAEEVSEEGLQGLFQTYLMRGLEQRLSRGTSLRDGEAPGG